MRRRLILLELNEVPTRVFKDFCDGHPGSALAYLRKSAVGGVTETQDVGHLSPWITWPTLHRGVINAEHGLSSFGQPLDKANQQFPPIWQILANSGVRVGVFGSLHSYPIPGQCNNYDFYVPDTFASGPECHPVELSVFQAFNLAMVAKSARNVSSEIPMHAWRFLLRAPKLGITPSTLGKVTWQLVKERISPWKKTRRRTFQAIVGFDVFYSQLKQFKPEFCTFFTNHIASAMHRYWAAAYPTDFESMEFDERWRRRYRGEIEWAMSQADLFVGKLVRYCQSSKETSLLIASSMGQAASDGRRILSQLVLSQPEKFMSSLGVPPDKWERRPAMSPQFNCVIKDEEVKQRFKENLKGLLIKKEQIDFVVQPGRFFSISFGHPNLSDFGADISLSGSPASPASLGLCNLIIDDEAGSTAYHMPEGIIFYYDPKTSSALQIEHPISTLAIAPSICKFFGIPCPEYMRSDGDLDKCLV